MNRAVLFVLVMLAATLPAAGPAAADDRSICFKNDSPPDVAIEACGRLISSGKLTGAELTQTYRWRSAFYRQIGEFDKAIADSSEVIRLDPKAAAAYRVRGIAHFWKGAYDGAISDQSEALRLEPTNTLSYGNRAVAYQRKGELDRAISDLNEIIRLAPNSADAHKSRGLISLWRAEYDRAITDFNEAIRLVPRDSQAYKHRGSSFEEKGDLKYALADFREAARLWPKNPEALAGIRRVEQKLAAVTPQVTPQATPQATLNAQPAPSVAATPTGPRVALVIGNGNYRHATRLPNPANDATDMAQVLRKLGFDVVEGRDLDKRGMEDKLREFGRKLDRAGLALFFYAGHGMQVGGKNYLVPVDAKLERAGDLNLDAVDVGNVLAQMEAEKRVNLIFLDACRDNPLARSFARSLGARSTSVGQGLATIQSAIGTMIAYATQPDAVALDGEGRNSPFTAALLKHLSTPGLEIATLMRRVRADVIAATREKQVPWDHSSLIGEVVLAR